MAPGLTCTTNTGVIAQSGRSAVHTIERRVGLCPHHHAPTTREKQHHVGIRVYHKSWSTPQKWPIRANNRWEDVSRKRLVKYQQHRSSIQREFQAHSSISGSMHGCIPRPKKRICSRVGYASPVKGMNSVPCALSAERRTQRRFRCGSNTLEEYCTFFRLAISNGGFDPPLFKREALRRKICTCGLAWTQYART